MKVKILRVVESSSHEALVAFSTACGGGLSRFCGFVPEINQSYDVELNLDDDFRWGENLKPSTLRAPMMCMNSGALHITARLVAGEGEGSAVLELDGAVILISLDQVVNGSPFFVDVLVHQSTLYPSGV